MDAELIHHPALFLILGGIAMGFLRGAPRVLLSLGLPLAAAWLLWQIPEGIYGGVPFLDYSLDVLRVDRLGRLFALVFMLTAMVLWLLHPCMRFASAAGWKCRPPLCMAAPPSARCWPAT